METQRAERPRRTAWIIGAIAVVMGVVLGAAAVMVLRSDESSAEAVRLVGADDAGADPFTESVQTGEVPVIEQPAVVAASNVRTELPQDGATSVLVATGTEPGLYGGSGDLKVCDPQKLVGYLREHPDKAGAWASVLGIAPDAIGDYVASLTPVVLLSDTLVTNHGFESGRATALTSVLQAGTAVMVDDQGVPRVKCNCGNPLTPPEVVPTADWDVRGDAWADFDTAAVTGVIGGDAVDALVVSDLVTGEPHEVPVGAAPRETPTTMPTPAASSDLRGVDWRNRTYVVEQYCGGPQVTLRDGTFENQAEYVSVQLAGVEYGDLTGDGSDEAMVKLECYAIGGNALPATPNIVFTSDASGPVQLGGVIQGNEATIVGGTVQTTDPVWETNDARCCPSSTTTARWTYDGSAWVSS